MRSLRRLAKLNLLPLDERGQMVFVVPLVLALAVGAMMYWGYAHMGQQASLTEKNAVTINQLLQSMEKRIVGVITNQTTPGSCATLAQNNPATPPLGALGYFSNFQAAPPATNFNIVLNTKAGIVAPYDCLITATEQTTFQTAYPKGLAVTINVNLLNQDPIGGYTTVSIDLAALFNTARSATGVGETRTAQQISQYRIQPATLKSYALIIAPPAGAVPALSTTKGATLRVVGSVYWDSNPAGSGLTSAPLGNALTLPAAGTAPSIIVDKRFDIRSNTVTGVTDDLATMKTSLKNGFNTSVLEGGVLPIEDDGDMGHSAWAQNLDYTNYAAGTPNQIYVMPDLNPQPQPPVAPYFSAGGPTPLAVVNNYSVGPAIYPYSAIHAGYCGTGNTCAATVTPTPGLVNAIPYSLAGDSPKTWIETLGTSCINPGALTGNAIGNAVPFIFNRKDQDLVINMSAGDLVFCGLVRARNIIVNVPPNTTGFILGQLMAQNITVNGQGSTLIVNNPLDQIGLVPALNNNYALNGGPNLLNQTALVYEWEQFASTIAQPFFVPMFTAISAAPNPNTVAPFRPHGPFVETGTNQNPPTCSPSAPTEDCVGYMVPCNPPTNSGATDGINPSPSPIPAPTTNTYLFCLRQTNSAPVPQFDPTLYFVANPVL